jgi:WD40 repeat protein
MSSFRTVSRLVLAGASALCCVLAPVVGLAQSSSPPRLQLKQHFQAHQLQGESLIQVGFAPSSRHFFTVASDGIAKIWTSPDQLVMQFSQNPPAMFFNARLEADNATLVTAAYNGLANLWSTHGSAPRSFSPHFSGVTDIAILPDAHGLITTSDDGFIRFWSIDGRLLKRIPQPGVSRHLSVAPHRQLVAVTQDIGSVAVLTTTGRFLQSFATAQGRLNDVIFSPDERMLITAGFDGTIKIWQIDASNTPPLLKRTIPAQLGSGWVEGLAINQSGLLASVSDDGILRLWSAEGELLSNLKLSHGHLLSVSFSPDGHGLLAAAQDGTVSSIELIQPR